MILQSKQPLIRLVAGVLSLIFTWTSGVGDPSVLANVGAQSLRPDNVSVEGGETPPLHLPAELGTVEEFHEPRSTNHDPRFIIHIQDAHANPSAQEKIKEILRFLAEQGRSQMGTGLGRKDSLGLSSMGPSLLVALEGAAGPLHPEYLDLLPNYPEASEAVVRDLAAKGELTGAELLAWEEYQKLKVPGPGPGTIRFIGVEDAALYRDNLRTYRELLFKRDEIETLLNPLRSELEGRASKVLSPDLLQFIREKRRRKEGNYRSSFCPPQGCPARTPLGWVAYLSFLSSQSKKHLGLDLADPIEQLRFPHLVRVLALGRIEKDFDPKKAEEQKMKFLLSLRAPQGAKQSGNNEIASSASPPRNDFAVESRTHAESLWRLAAQKGISLTDYPDYLKSIAQQILLSEIEMDSLSEEIERAESGLIEKLATKDEERRLLRELENFSLLEKLLRLELTRKEYEKIVRVIARRPEGSTKQSSNSEIASLTSFARNDNRITSLCRSALRFYSIAHERERALLENALLDSRFRGNDSSAPITVLIAGGFHTQGLTELMKQKGIGYAVIRPRIEKIEDEGLYHKSLRDEHADISAYFPPSLHPRGVIPVNKQEALLLKGLFETAAPQLWETYKLPYIRMADEVAEVLNRHPVLSEKFEASATATGDRSVLELALRGDPAPTSDGMKLFSTHAVADALIEGANYGGLRSVILRPDGIRHPEEVRRTDEGSRMTKGTRVEFAPAGLQLRIKTAEGPARAESRAPTPADELHDERLEFLKRRGYQIVPDVDLRDGRGIISFSFNSKMIPLGPAHLIKNDEIFRDLGNGTPPKHILLPYVNLPAAAPEPPILGLYRQILQERGMTFQGLMRGMHDESPWVRVLPYLYVDPEVLEIYKKYKRVWEDPKRRKLAFARLFDVLLEPYLSRSSPDQPSPYEKYQMEFENLHNHLLPNSYVAMRYTSRYGNEQEMITFFNALEKARRHPKFRDPKLEDEKNVVVFTFLQKDAAYEDFNGVRHFFHDRLLSLLEHGDSRLQPKINFINLRDPNNLQFPSPFDPNAITVVNIPDQDSPVFNFMHFISDVALVAGDMGKNNAALLAILGIPVVSLFGPHPGSQLSLKTQYFERLSRQSQSPQRAMDIFHRVLGPYFDVQMPYFYPPSDRYLPDLEDALASVFVNERISGNFDSEGSRYRATFADLVDGSYNMFNFLIRVIEMLERGMSPREIMDAEPPVLESGFEIHGSFQLRNHRITVPLLQAVTGYGDARRAAQLDEAFRLAGAVKDPHDVLVYLDDTRLQDLAFGIEKLEKVMDVTRGRFLFIPRDKNGPLRDSSGRVRYLVLRNKEARPPKELDLKHTKAESLRRENRRRSEVRSGAQEDTSAVSAKSETRAIPELEPALHIEEEKLRALAKTVEEIPSGRSTPNKPYEFDLREARRQASILNPDFPFLAGIDDQMLAAADNERYQQLMGEVSYEVFLRAGQVTKFTSDPQGNLKLVLSRLLKETLRPERYLDAIDLYRANIQGLVPIGDPTGITGHAAGRFAFLDPDRARKRAQHSYRTRIRPMLENETQKPADQQAPFLTALRTSLEAAGIAGDEAASLYGEFFGVLEFGAEEFQHAKDMSYAQEVSGNSRLYFNPNWSLETVEAMMRKPSRLEPAFLYRHYRAQIPQYQTLGIARESLAMPILELSGQLGGLITRMQGFIEEAGKKTDPAEQNRLYALAYASFFKYLVIQRLYTLQDPRELQRAQQPHRIAAVMAGDTLAYTTQISLRTPNFEHQVVEGLERGTSSARERAERALALASAMYQTNFLIDDERRIIRSEARTNVRSVKKTDVKAALTDLEAQGLLTKNQKRDKGLAGRLHERIGAGRYGNKNEFVQEMGRVLGANPVERSERFADSLEQKGFSFGPPGAVVVSPEEESYEFLALTLESGVVEREADYVEDAGFWRAVEQANPGTLEKVKKLIAIYADSQTQPLVKGVDYDLRISRSYVIHLRQPVSFGGAVFHEVIAKGAPFEKSTEGQTFDSIAAHYSKEVQAMVAEIGKHHYEFEKNGTAYREPFVDERTNALSYEDAETEFRIGRSAYRHGNAGVNVLPSILARYRHDKGSEGGPLGVVVMASPYKIPPYQSKDPDYPMDELPLAVMRELPQDWEWRADPLFFTMTALAVNERVISAENYAAAVRESFKEYGRALRRFHDAGYTHGNPHASNTVTEFKLVPTPPQGFGIELGEVTIRDLSDGRMKQGLSREQAFGYQVRDLDYAMMTTWLSEVFGPYTKVIFAREFFAGYLGDTRADQIFGPMNQVLDYHFRFFIAKELFGVWDKMSKEEQAARQQRLEAEVNRQTLGQGALGINFARRAYGNTKSFHDDLHLASGENRKINWNDSANPLMLAVREAFEASWPRSEQRIQARSELRLSAEPKADPGGITFLTTPIVQSFGDSATVEIAFQLEKPESLNQFDFFVHWGSYDEDEIQWTDHEVLPKEIKQLPGGNFRLKTRIHPGRRGRFRATIYAQPFGSSQRIWQGLPRTDDVAFNTIQDDQIAREKAAQISDRESQKERWRQQIRENLHDLDRFVDTIRQLATKERARGIGKLLYEAVQGIETSGALLSQYHKRLKELLEEAQGEAREKLLPAYFALETLGIGEIVFVAPEGSNAISGGLARVIEELPRALARYGISVTVIVPLYEEDNGNKHPSAAALLEEGFQIHDKRIPISGEPVAEVSMDIGPSYESGTQVTGLTGEKIRSFRRHVRSPVHESIHEGVRYLFLRHPRLANLLYPNVGSDEELRRAIFLSRAALEIMHDSAFGVDPHIVISSDWVAGLIPGLLKLDPRYNQDKALREAETIHMIHNYGLAYQGRIFTNQFGVDLSGLFNLYRFQSGRESPEVKEEIREWNERIYRTFDDPHDDRWLNITANALASVKKAILTVSKPYAEQMLTPERGEGLYEKVLKSRSHLLFGISNGIDMRWTRRLFQRFATGELPAEEDFSEERFLQNLPGYKKVVKKSVQKKYGLTVNEEAILMTFIGRVAEQKGMALLTEIDPATGKTILETILDRDPRVQILLGGPLANGDSKAEGLQRLVQELMQRPEYEGRIVGIPQSKDKEEAAAAATVFADFVPPEETLEIMLGSDFFFMPSRYEPGGLTQLEASAAGTIVIGRKVDGIDATLEDYQGTPQASKGNAFLFVPFEGSAFLQAVLRAIQAYQAYEETNKEDWHALIRRVAGLEHDWNHRIPRYLSLLQFAGGVFGHDGASTMGDLEEHLKYSYLKPNLTRLSQISATGSVLSSQLAPAAPSEINTRAEMRSLQSTIQNIEEKIAAAELELGGQKIHGLQDLVDYLADSEDRETLASAVSKEGLFWIFGAEDPEAVRQATSFFIEKLYSKSMKTVVVSGGIGKGTPHLVENFVLDPNEKSGNLGLDSIHLVKGTESFHFSTISEALGQDYSKPMRPGAPKIKTPLHEITPYVSEGDIYLEQFLNLYKRLNKIQISPKNILILTHDDFIYEGDSARLKDPSLAQKIREYQSKTDGLVVFLENASTNTGDNVTYSLKMLQAAGVLDLTNPEKTKRIIDNSVLNQEPPAMLRTKHTLARQIQNRGILATPVSFTYAPKINQLDDLGKSHLLDRVFGEFERFAKPEYFGQYMTRPDGYTEAIADFILGEAGPLIAQMRQLRRTALRQMALERVRRELQAKTQYPIADQHSEIIQQTAMMGATNIAADFPILILNFDPHHDAYEESRPSTNWKTKLEEQKRAIVATIIPTAGRNSVGGLLAPGESRYLEPRFTFKNVDYRSISNANDSGLLDLKSMTVEINGQSYAIQDYPGIVWLSFDYDFFSLSEQVLLDEFGETATRDVYHVDMNNLADQLTAIERYLIQSGIRVDEVVAYRSQNSLAGKANAGWINAADKAFLQFRKHVLARSEVRAKKKIVHNFDAVAKSYREDGYFKTLSRFKLTPRLYAVIIQKGEDYSHDYFGLSYAEAVSLVGDKTRRKPFKTLHSELTGRNLILATLDTVPGFKVARRRKDIRTMAELYRQYVIGYEAKDKVRYLQDGQVTFFYEVGGLQGLMGQHRPYLAKTGSPPALLRLAIPELIDRTNADALDPLEVEQKYWNDAENAKYHILLALDTIPGFKDAREREDILTMAELYRRYVIGYKAKDKVRYLRDGQTTFFYEAGGLKELMGVPRPYLTKINSPAALLRLAIPELIDNENLDALRTEERPTDYPGDETFKTLLRNHEAKLAPIAQELKVSQPTISKWIASHGFTELARELRVSRRAEVRMQAGVLASEAAILSEAAAIMEKDPESIRPGPEKTHLILGNTPDHPTRRVIVVSDLHQNKKYPGRSSGEVHLDAIFEDSGILSDLAAEQGDIIDLGDVIHTDHAADREAYRLSRRPLVRMAQRQKQFPHRVHFLPGTHEMGERFEQILLKGGDIQTFQFQLALLDAFPDREVRAFEESLRQYIDAAPTVATIRLADGWIFLAHTAPGLLPGDDLNHPTVGIRSHDDLAHLVSLGGGRNHENPFLYGNEGFVWTRNFKAGRIQKFHETIGVQATLVGHTPPAKKFEADYGFEVRVEKALGYFPAAAGDKLNFFILSSDDEPYYIDINTALTIAQFAEALERADPSVFRRATIRAEARNDLNALVYVPETEAAFHRLEIQFKKFGIDKNYSILLFPKVIWKGTKPRGKQKGFKSQPDIILTEIADDADAKKALAEIKEEAQRRVSGKSWKHPFGSDYGKFKEWLTQKYAYRTEVRFEEPEDIEGDSVLSAGDGGDAAIRRTRRERRSELRVPLTQEEPPLTHSWFNPDSDKREVPNPFTRSYALKRDDLGFGESHRDKPFARFGEFKFGRLQLAKKSGRVVGVPEPGLLPGGMEFGYSGFSGLFHSLSAPLVESFFSVRTALDESSEVRGLRERINENASSFDPTRKKSERYLRGRSAPRAHKGLFQRSFVSSSGSFGDKFTAATYISTTRIPNPTFNSKGEEGANQIDTRPAPYVSSPSLYTDFVNSLRRNVGFIEDALINGLYSIGLLIISQIEYLIYEKVSRRAEARTDTAIESFVTKYGAQGHIQAGRLPMTYDFREAITRIRQHPLAGEEPRFLDIRNKIDGLMARVASDSKSRAEALYRYLGAWLARTTAKPGEIEEIPLDLKREMESHREYSIVFVGREEDRPQEARMEPIEPQDHDLILQWDPRLTKYKDSWEAAIQGKSEGFKLVTLDKNGQKHLEGFITFNAYAEKLGVYLAFAEVDPSNRSGQDNIQDYQARKLIPVTYQRTRFQGVAPVLITRVALESVRLGHEGWSFGQPHGLTGAGLNRGESLLSKMGARKYQAPSRHTPAIPNFPQLFYYATTPQIAVQIYQDQLRRNQEDTPGKVMVLDTTVPVRAEVRMLQPLNSRWVEIPGEGRYFAAAEEVARDWHEALKLASQNGEPITHPMGRSHTLNFPSEYLPPLKWDIRYEPEQEQIRARLVQGESPVELSEESIVWKLSGAEAGVPVYLPGEGEAPRYWASVPSLMAPSRHGQIDSKFVSQSVLAYLRETLGIEFARTLFPLDGGEGKDFVPLPRENFYVIAHEEVATDKITGPWRVIVYPAYGGTNQPPRILVEMTDKTRLADLFVLGRDGKVIAILEFGKHPFGDVYLKWRDTARLLDQNGFPLSHHVSFYATGIVLKDEDKRTGLTQNKKLPALASKLIRSLRGIEIEQINILELNHDLMGVHEPHLSIVAPSFVEGRRSDYILSYKPMALSRILKSRNLQGILGELVKVASRPRAEARMEEEIIDFHKRNYHGGWAGIREYPHPQGRDKILKGFELKDGTYIPRHFQPGAYSLIHRVNSEHPMIREAKVAFGALVRSLQDVFPGKKIDYWQLGEENAHLSLGLSQQHQQFDESVSLLTSEDIALISPIIEEETDRSKPIQTYRLGYGLTPDGGFVIFLVDPSKNLFDFKDKILKKANQLTGGKISGRPKPTAHITVGRILSLPYADYEEETREEKKREILEKLRRLAEEFEREWAENIAHPKKRLIYTIADASFVHEIQWLSVRGNYDRLYPFASSEARGDHASAKDSQAGPPTQYPGDERFEALLRQHEGRLRPIADELGVSQSTISRWISQHGFTKLAQQLRAVRRAEARTAYPPSFLEGLKVAFADRYDLGEVQNVKELTGGVGSKPPVEITTDKGSFVFHPLGSNHDRARLIISFMRHLKAKGLPVPQLYGRDDLSPTTPSADGYLNLIGNSYFVLEEFMSVGKKIRRQDATVRHYESLGKLAAEIQNANADFVPEGHYMWKERSEIADGFDLSQFDRLKDELTEKQKTANLTASEAFYLQHADSIQKAFASHLDRFKAIYNDFLRKGFTDTHLAGAKTNSVIHNDLTFGNVQFDEDANVVALLDFGQAQEDHRIQEFNNMILGTAGFDDSFVFDWKMAQVAMQAYQAHVQKTLTPQEIFGIREILRLRLLEMVHLMLFVRDTPFNALQNPHLLSELQQALTVLEKFDAITRAEVRMKINPEIRRYIEQLPLPEGHVHFGSSVPFYLIWRLALARTDIDWTEISQRLTQVYQEIEKKPVQVDLNEILTKARVLQAKVRRSPQQKKELAQLKMNFRRFSQYRRKQKLSLEHFTTIDIVVRTLSKGGSDLFRELAREIATAYYREGVRYLELRTSLPKGDSSQNTYAKILAKLQAIKAGLQDAENEINSSLGPDTIGFEAKMVVTLEKFHPMSILEEQTDVLFQVLKDYPELTGWVVGVDAANREQRKAPVEFIGLYRQIDQYNEQRKMLRQPQLGKTYHVGEDFDDVSIESGIRRVHEAVEQLKVDRIGHGLILGIDVEPILGTERKEHISERIAQIYYDLKAAKFDPEALTSVGLIIPKEDLTKELLEYTKGGPEAEDIAARIAPLIRSLLREGTQAPDKEKRLFDELIHFKTLHPESFVTLRYDRQRVRDLVKRQHYVLNKIIEQNVAIEISPTINVRIGPIVNHAQHPLRLFSRYRYTGAQRKRKNRMPVVTVNTDNPRIFGINLVQEYADIATALDLNQEDIRKLVLNGFRHRLGGRSLKYQAEIAKVLGVGLSGLLDRAEVREQSGVRALPLADDVVGEKQDNSYQTNESYRSKSIRRHLLTSFRLSQHRQNKRDYARSKRSHHHPSWGIFEKMADKDSTHYKLSKISEHAGHPPSLIGTKKTLHTIPRFNPKVNVAKGNILLINSQIENDYNTNSIEENAVKFAAGFRDLRRMPDEVVGIAEAAERIYDFADRIAARLNIALEEAQAMIILAVLGDASYAGASNPVKDLIRSKMTPRYADFILNSEGPPIHLLHPINEGPLSEGLLVTLGLAKPKDRLTFIGTISQSQARVMEESFEKFALEHGLPPHIRAVLRVAGSGPETSALIQSLKRIAGEDQIRIVGTLDDSLEMLEALGYLGKNRSRLHYDEMAEDVALVIAASLLRNLIPDEPYNIQNIRAAIRAKGIDVNVLISELTEVIRSLRHVSTQA